MSYMVSRPAVPFGAITIYRASSALADGAAAVSALLRRRDRSLASFSPAELEDLGLSVADLPVRRKGVLARLVDSVRAGIARRRTVKMLSALSDAQLKDIGLTRWDVAELAAGHVAR